MRAVLPVGFRLHWRDWRTLTCAGHGGGPNGGAGNVEGSAGAGGFGSTERRRGITAQIDEQRTRTIRAREDASE